jgi:hypothetical protein
MRFAHCRERGRRNASCAESAWCRKEHQREAERVARGVLSCAVRLSRLRAQPLTPPDMNDALRRSVDDREKLSFASSVKRSRQGF